ncbi:2976_t:CDS:2 [Dentiscutata heterogama]|uniref:2976_t:CDS:1 n=1 Tax=Dentiscutata heterogama TaxID=1316150 RepID=A0ACA9JZ08_9GLOM|nr:2976_t:CDS:2 [Dentiscutata heterogama]
MDEKSSAAVSGQTFGSSFPSSFISTSVTPLSKMLNLWVHDEKFSKQDFIMNPDCFPDAKPGQLLEIYHSIESSDITNHLIVKVDTFDKEYIGKEKPILQVNAEAVSAEYIEFSFRDQYIGRGDMWRLVRSLMGTCVYLGKRIEFAGCIRAQVSCGYITGETKPIFRSESAKLFIFVQMSREMWEFDEDGELYFEKAIEFFSELFKHWKQLGTNHVVSIVLFSRVFYDFEYLENDPELQAESSLMKDYYKRSCKDFYKVIVDWETRSDWNCVLMSLKNELLNYQPAILMRNKKCQDGCYNVLAGKNSYAFEGNILEAINLALNPFDKHYVDRDLMRTGLSIIIVTPGCGRFEVDKKLLRITTERIVDNGIGLDLVCLSKAPLHAVPLFKFKSQEISKAPLPDWFDKKTHKWQQAKDMYLESRDPLDFDEKNPTIDANYVYYQTPDWVECNFYSRYHDKPLKPGKFVPRCRMYEIQMMGIMEHEISSILIPHLPDKRLPSGDGEFDYDQYDDEIFTDVKSKSRQMGFPYGNVHDSLNTANRTDLSQLRKSNDDFTMYSKNFSGELARSLPKGLIPLGLMSSLHPEQNRPTNFKSARLSGSNLIDSSIINSREPFMRSHLHESSQEGSFRGDQTDDDDGPVVTSSTVEAIPIKSSTRSVRNSIPPSPKGSIPESNKSSFASDKGRSVNASRHVHQVLLNPCNRSNKAGNGIRLKRWEHVFPQPKLMNSVKWSALHTPACLPLTTDHFPTINEYCYEEGTYTISVDPDTFSMNQEHSSEESKTETLLNEMISQRLAQGYQLIVPSSGSVNVIESAKNIKSTSNMTDNLSISPEFTKSPNFRNNKEQFTQLNSFAVSNPCYLSMGRHVHKLTYYPAEHVEVKRYLRKTEYKLDPIPYSCVIWPRCQESYELREVKFNYPNTNYKWNHVDQLACGYQDDLSDSDDLRFWRTRFVLIPMENVPSNLLKTANETLDEEEIRVSGIYKFFELFEKASWTPPNERKEANNKTKKENVTPSLQLTTCDPSIFVKSIEDVYPRRASVNPPEERLSRDSKISTIVSAMMNPTTGIVRDRRWHLRFYQNAIVGNEYVDWLLKKFPDINTREDAVSFGNELQEKGVIEHCTKRHQFLDGYYFYQINEDHAERKSAKKWFVSKAAKFSTSSAPNSPIPTATSKLSKRPVIELTKAMQIDIDPLKKSDRRETATLHYDMVFNPDNCYHFQLHWLGCTARLIEELLQKWSGNADRYGLKLVEVPIEQAMSLTDNNPFQSPTLVKLSVLPPPLDSLGKKLHPALNQHLYFEKQLIKHFKFILDVEADDVFPEDVEVKYSYSKTSFKYSQYIHRSGVAFIQICEDGYLWMNNRLFTTHNPSSSLMSNAIVRNSAHLPASLLTNSNVVGRDSNLMCGSVRDSNMMSGGVRDSNMMSGGVRDSNIISKSGTNLAPNPDMLLKEFQNFCGNEALLKQFWEYVISGVPEQGEDETEEEPEPYDVA